MGSIQQLAQRFRWAVVAAGILLLGACSQMPWSNQGVTLSGDQEVPPVSTMASGSAKITITADHAVSGTVDFSGMRAIAAHIHVGAPGRSGPVIIPLAMTSETSYAVPAGARLSDSQYAAYLKGDLYVNVHSAAHRGGEIRAQLHP